MPNGKAKPRKKKRMNARQIALVKNLAKGMTQKDAAIAAGYSKNNPDKVAHQALQQIQRNWSDDLDSVVGSPRSVLENYLVPMMNAKHIKAALGKKGFQYSKPLVAWEPRRAGLDIYCKIAGAYKMPELSERGPIQVQVVTNVVLPSPALAGTNGHKDTPIDPS